jgi:AraC-like DNA-binding protein
LDLIFISGDEGLSVFVKSIEKTHQKLIIDEFNKNAVFKSENQISFGSIHGVYKINDVNELIKSSYLTNLDNYNQSEYNYENLIVLFIVLLFLFSTRIFKTKKLSNEELVVEIKKYINKNLKTVTLNSLEDKFNIDYNAINNLQNEFRPAKYIKNKRNEIAKEMFLNGEKVSKISKKTGYSESYLTKNKYSFTRK